MRNSTLSFAGSVTIALFLGWLIGGLGVPQDVQAQTFDLSGFVKSSYLYDTRQVAAARETEFLLYPVEEAGPGEDDASATDRLASYQIFSRLGLTIGGFPQVMGGDVQGYFESDFFGPMGLTTNTLRIRRAHVKMTWDDREVLFGVEWSPLFTLSVFPRTIATEAGTPFNPFGRQPMVKLTLKRDNFRFVGAAAWQFDAFQSATFLGTSGIQQQQLSALPGLHGQVQYVSGDLTLGGGGYVKALRPVATGERVFTGAALAYGAYVGDRLNVRGKAVYGGDLHDHVKTSGIIYDAAEDPEGNFVRDAYQALNSFSTWLDVEGKGTVVPGLFAGYLTNLGASDPVSGTVIATGRGTNIDALWEIAPRMALNYGPMRFGFELQITTAAYASEFDENYAPTGDTESVTNVRGNVSVFLFF